MVDDMAVYIANLGKYNEGYLVGAWLDVYKRQAYILAGNVITCELLMMKFQRQRRTKFSLVQEPLSKKIKDAMNVAVTSTLARGRN